jgi:ubiquinone/menaquinone biosynthesis C-methylase UbiE
MSERKKWDLNHTTQHYRDVYSILDDVSLQSRYRESLIKIAGSDIQRILIPGCGSNITLQKLCWEIYGSQCEIYAIDWSHQALLQSRAKTEKLNISVKYLEGDFTQLGHEDGYFNIVLLSNTLVSRDFDANVAALKEISRVTIPGGKITGAFPCAFAMFDYALTSGLAEHWLADGTVDAESRKIYEQSQDMHQRLFTPLELLSACGDANLELEEMQIHFYKGAGFASQMVQLYKTPYSEKYSLWGLYIDCVVNV